MVIFFTMQSTRTLLRRYFTFFLVLSSKSSAHIMLSTHLSLDTKISELKKYSPSKTINLCSMEK